MEWVRSICVAHVLAQADVVCTRRCCWWRWCWCCHGGGGLRCFDYSHRDGTMVAVTNVFNARLRCSSCSCEYTLSINIIHDTPSLLVFQCFTRLFVLSLSLSVCLSLAHSQPHLTADIEGRALREDRILELRQLQMHFQMKTS